MSDYPVIILENYIGIDHYPLDVDAHDPGKRDIGYLVYVSKLIPKSPMDIGKVDSGVLASLCLAAAQEATRYHAEALMWWRMKEIKSNSNLATAIAGITPATGAEKKAKNDDDYVRSATLMAKGEAITRFYDNMRGNFEQGHYWAKEKEKGDNSERKMSGYEPHALKVGGDSATKRTDQFQESEEKTGDFSFQG